MLVYAFSINIVFLLGSLARLAHRWPLPCCFYDVVDRWLVYLVADCILCLVVCFYFYFGDGVETVVPEVDAVLFNFYFYAVISLFLFYPVLHFLTDNGSI